MLNRGMLKRINERPRKPRLLPLAGAGAGAAALGAALLVLAPYPLLALAAVPVGAAGILAAHRAERARGIITLDYNNLGDDVTAHFAVVREALEALSSSGMIWRLNGGAGQAPEGADIILCSPERTPVRVGLLETPGIRANVPIWGIDAGDVKLFFFPEAALIYRSDHYVGVSYKSVKVAFSFARFSEKEEVPEDAEVVEDARRRTGDNGSYDRRYGRRPRIPVVLYGLVDMTFPHHKLEVRLQVSSLSAAARFARTLSAGETGKSTAREKHMGKIAWARRVLGVAEGASMSEIGAAYKKMARAYHPDKVLELPAEVRELSEWRMKEISSAYAELKRYRRSHTDA